MEFVNDVFSLYLGKLSFVDIFGELTVQPETLGAVGEFWSALFLGELMSFFPLFGIGSLINNPGTIKEGIATIVLFIVYNLINNVAGIGILTDDSFDPLPVEVIATNLAEASFFHFVLGISLLQFGISSFLLGRGV